MKRVSLQYCEFGIVLVISVNQMECGLQQFDY